MSTSSLSRYISSFQFCETVNNLRQQEYVSNGYIVVAPYHADGSATVSRALKGGQWTDVHHTTLEASSLSKPQPAEYAFRNKQLNQRVRGMSSSWC